MTTLADRPNTALLVIDVQNGVVAGAPNRDTVIANIDTLVGKARAEDVPVIWVQHSNDHDLQQGSDNWQYVPELVRRDEEPLVHKRYGDSFEDTGLEALLAERGWAVSSSRAPRPTRASARPSTGRSSGDTT